MTVLAGTWYLGVRETRGVLRWSVTRGLGALYGRE